MQEAIAAQIKVGWSYWFSLRHFQFPNSDERNQMVLTDKQKTVIENDFNEKGWNAYKIWKKHSSFESSHMAVHNLIKKIKETGSTERRKGSGRPVTATTEENASIFEELVCSQEDEPGTHNSIRQIASRIWISKSLVHFLVMKKNLHCYKRLKTPQLNSACCNRRAERAGKLLQHFSIHSLYHSSCFKIRRTFPFKYQLINFWDRIQEEVYNGRYCYPFATIDELKRKISEVWDKCATNLPQIHKVM